MRYHSRKGKLSVNSSGQLLLKVETATNPTKPETQVAAEGTTRMSRDTLSITDNRTGKAYEVPIKDDTIRAMDLRQIKVKPDDFGMMSYDPAFSNTALCQSKITYIDGDKGILRYRGYSIEELAEKSTYLETAYLILHGELPTRAQLEDWTYHVTHHTFIHESVKKFLDGFHYDAHPDGHDDFGDRGALHLLSRGERHLQQGVAPKADLSLDRKDANARRVFLPAQPGHALCLSGQ